METIDKQIVNKIDTVMSFRQKHPFLSAVALLGSVVVLTGSAGRGGCGAGPETEPTPERLTEVREDLDPISRFEAEFIDGGAYHGNSGKIYFGQTCLADTPYDTNPYGWRTDDASNGRPQAGIEVSPERPNELIVISSLPGMPKLVFEGLIDASSDLQPTTPETVSQLEAYGCEVEEQE